MWEIRNKDVARPSAEKLHQIAVALGTTAEYLLSADEVTEAEAGRSRLLPQVSEHETQR